jgi:hypothetical protein
MSNSQRYCIGKASRYHPMDIVKHPPLRFQWSKMGDAEHALRSAIYYSVEEAKAACIEAAKYNPVGFVVLLLAEPD